MNRDQASLQSVDIPRIVRDRLHAYRGRLLDELEQAQHVIERKYEQFLAVERATELRVKALAKRIAAAHEDDGEGPSHALLREYQEAADLLQRIRRHRHVIEDAIRDYARSQRKLRAYLESDLPRTMELLAVLSTYGDRYLSAGIPSSATMQADMVRVAASVGLDLDGTAALREELRASEGHAFRESDTPAANAFLEYQGTGYTSFNGYLRSKSANIDPDTHDQSALVAKIAAMQSAFGSTQLKQDTALYRGIPRGGRVEGTLDHLVTGNIFSDPGFVSTSSNEMISRGTFAGSDGFLFTIRTPAGVPYIPLSAPGDHFDEAELVLPPGTGFYITNDFFDQKLTVFQAVALPPGVSGVPSGTDPMMFARKAWKGYLDDIAI